MKDTIIISLAFDSQSNSYIFTVGLIETLMREYHITITKENLSRNALDEYIQPFFEWERCFPVVLDDSLSISDLRRQEADEEQMKELRGAGKRFKRI